MGRYPNPNISLSALARELGVAPQTVVQWRRRFPDFPPSVTEAPGPVLVNHADALAWAYSRRDIKDRLVRTRPRTHERKLLMDGVHCSFTHHPKPVPATCRMSDRHDMFLGACDEHRDKYRDIFRIVIDLATGKPIPSPRDTLRSLLGDQADDDRVTITIDPDGTKIAALEFDSDCWNNDNQPAVIHLTITTLRVYNADTGSEGPGHEEFGSYCKGCAAAALTAVLAERTTWNGTGSVAILADNRHLTGEANTQ